MTIATAILNDNRPAAPAMRPCAQCGTPTRIELLDSKPGPGHFTIAQLNAAADAGQPFDRMECEDCYGPGYVPLGFVGPCDDFSSDGRGCCANCGHFHGPDGMA